MLHGLGCCAMVQGVHVVSVSKEQLGEKKNDLRSQGKKEGEDPKQTRKTMKCL